MPPRSTIHRYRVQGPTDTPGSQQNIPFFTPDSPEFDISTLTTKSLVIPIVSVANVPQLAIDILIASFSLSRLGTFSPKYHVPIVGGRECDQHGVTTAFELFGKSDVSFVVVQQRSPTQKEKFTASLFNFVKDTGFKSLLFVSAVDSTNRTDSQMHTPLYQLIPAVSPPLEESPISLLTSLPEYRTGISAPLTQSTIPGGGLTRRLFSSVPDGWSICTGFLVWIGMEGDNRGDATLVASVVAKILSEDRRIQEWKQPESWQQGLFGTPNDQTLFG
ncbi:PAC2 family-domain-containing protein [Hysterangium stoloniferum]|nr:PAC2 family-domain-containing protein [Hysterangium stoloniferum]